MPIDTARQLQDLLRTAEAFRAVTIQSGALHHVSQNEYVDQLRALEAALQPANYVINTDVTKEAGGLHPEEIVIAVESWMILEQLRAPEGAQVTLICDNPDFGMGPNAGVEIIDDWTAWKTRRFDGDTVLDCLRAALKASKEPR